MLAPSSPADSTTWSLLPGVLEGNDRPNAFSIRPRPQVCQHPAVSAANWGRSLSAHVVPKSIYLYGRVRRSERTRIATRH